jgi:hypothetical protein
LTKLIFCAFFIKKGENMRKTNNIACPFCHKEFQLTDAITTQIESELKNDFKDQIEVLKAEKNQALENQKNELELKMSERKSRKK